MRHLEERILDRRPLRGEWNYTVRPAARPDRAAEPPRPAPPWQALAALAGIADLPALLAAVAVPWQAAREQPAGPGPRRPPAPGQRRHPLEAPLRGHRGRRRLPPAPRHALQPASAGSSASTSPPSASPPAVSSPLLAPHGITRDTTAPRISTPDRLRQHAASRGITINGITTHEPAKHPYQDDMPEAATKNRRVPYAPKIFAIEKVFATMSCDWGSTCLKSGNFRISYPWPPRGARSAAPGTGPGPGTRPPVRPGTGPGMASTGQRAARAPVSTACVPSRSPRSMNG